MHFSALIFLHHKHACMIAKFVRNIFRVLLGQTLDFIEGKLSIQNGRVTVIGFINVSNL